MARPGLREEVIFEVNIARLAGISQEIREGGLSGKRELCSWASLSEMGTKVKVILQRRFLK